MKKFIGKSTNKRVTPNTKRVADVLIDWYRPGRRHSWASRETLANELAIAQSTVSAAIAVLHDLGLIYTKTGGFGAKANEFVPNFRLVINPDTGSIIKNDSFKKSRVSADSTDSTARLESVESVESQAHSKGEAVPNEAGDPQTSANVVSDAEDSTGENPVSDNRTQEKGCDPQTSANVVSDIRTPYCVSNKRGAPASPTSPGGSAVGTPAHEKGLTRYITFHKLGFYLDLGPKDLKAAIGGRGSVKDQKDLDDVCRHCLYTAEGKTLGLFDKELPSDGLDYGHVVIHGGEGRVSFVEDGIPYASLKQSSWLGIEYREA
jgi:hypothetical protein